MDTAGAEEQRKEADEEEREEVEEEEQVYKTKVVQFLGRSTPIVLQNDNGPCPLLAICNVLLLRNNISLSLDTSEVSLKKLLSLVAERLIDSNSNVENKDDEYVHNQQQNIADAIDLLSHLATGIDVNVLFRKINDFEFTRECAIFDLLDIGLYHGWIVDPQDTDTSSVIGSKSYNTLVGELVVFETRNTGGQDKSVQDEDSVDFAAATNATFKVPSPCLSRGRSFDESPVSISCEPSGRKGDLEEEEELIRVLELSRDEVSMPVNESLKQGENISTSTGVSTHFQTSASGVQAESSVGLVSDDSEASHQSEFHVSQVSSVANNLEEKGTSHLNNASGENLGHIASEGSGDIISSRNSGEIKTNAMLVQQTLPFLSSKANDSAACSTYKHPMNISRDDESISETCLQNNSTPEFPLRPGYHLYNGSPTDLSTQPISDLDSSGGRSKLVDVADGVNPSHEAREPMYEGEECILDPGILVNENREPIYEGEMIVAKQAERREGDASDVRSIDEAAQQHNTALFSTSSEDGQLIRNFLRNNASQLTIYGLFCLQEGLKERELCVFFRNNHFSTMFKYNGELYLLATDQGFINQPDLVWEKLNEVNGDTVFMTGNFKEFKAGTQVNGPWDEQNAMTSTADYLATLEVSQHGTSTACSDLQLAIALQQQEFEQQPQNQQPQNQQLSSGSSRPRLVTGPQVQRSRPHPPHKQESKSKEKCIVM